jgi:hypothetical protein
MQTQTVLTGALVRTEDCAAIATSPDLRNVDGEELDDCLDGIRVNLTLRG